MNSIFIFLVIAILFAVVSVVISQVMKKSSLSVKEKEDIGKYYYIKKSLFTPAEYVFYQELQRQNNNQYLIHCKVRLEDIVGVAKGVGTRYREMRNHIKSRHVDFVLVDQSGDISIVVELDDRSHDTEKAQVGDKLKNQIFNYNKVRFYRVSVGINYTKKVAEILSDKEKGVV